MTTTAYEDQLYAVQQLVDQLGTGLDLTWRPTALPGRLHWSASIERAGVRVSVERHRGPVQALEALAHQVLTDAPCPHCGRPVDLPVAAAGDVDAARCTYRREGRRWLRGCEPTPRPRHRLPRPARRMPTRKARRRR